MLKPLLSAAILLGSMHANAAGLVLHSERALIVDRDTGQTLYAKEANSPVPIASVTKLLMAMVVLDEKPDMTEMLEVTESDVDTLKFSTSRLPVGTQLTRGAMLQLALMSSENRAAHALARSSKQGLARFVASMNTKAAKLSMSNARFVDPTGLSPRNRASASDLGKLVGAASNYTTIKAYTTARSGSVSVGGQKIDYRNTNPVVGRTGWDVLVSKTGFISEAGRCVVLGFKAAGRNLAVVLLGAGTAVDREADLQTVHDWAKGVEHTLPVVSKVKAVRALKPGQAQGKATFASVAARKGQKKTART